MRQVRLSPERQCLTRFLAGRSPVPIQVPSEVVTIVKQLAKKHHSAALAQLASKIAAVVKYGSLGGQDLTSAPLQ